VSNSFSSVIKPIIIIIVVLLLMPFMLQMFGNGADVAGQTFNETVDLGGTQVNLGGLAKLILLLAGVFVPIYLLEKYL